MLIPDAPTPLTLAGPATDDRRMAGLSASVDPFLGAPGIHAAQCADAACHQGDHAMCGDHIAAHCADLCPRICRRFPEGKRCAYGARAPDRLPGALPALDDDAERKLLHAHCVPNATRYDDFEQHPASALLLLAHNTNLGSFPALQRLRLSDPGPGCAASSCGVSGVRTVTQSSDRPVLQHCQCTICLKRPTHWH
jgi:hypothetical protein